MRTLTASERRALRAKAHALHPVVGVGQQGLTPAVLHEIDVNLLAHELIKVRVISDDRDEREALLARICDAMDAAAVQHIGKLFVLWRPKPKESTVPKPPLLPARRPPAPAREPRRPMPRPGSRSPRVGAAAAATTPRRRRRGV